MKIEQTIIRFPDLKLATRDAHKLRGYFATLFRDKSPLLHNHFEDGSLLYRYPLVQYKVINSIPILIGLNEGATLLNELFIRISEIRINGIRYPILEKNLTYNASPAGLAEGLLTYRFANLWMALNQQNYRSYNAAEGPDRQKMLNTILQNNLLSFFKGTNIWIDARLMATGTFKQHETKFKTKQMVAFSGEFVANVILPDLIGIGKSVSRGFGTIQRKWSHPLQIT